MSVVLIILITYLEKNMQSIKKEKGHTSTYSRKMIAEKTKNSHSFDNCVFFQIIFQTNKIKGPSLC